MRADKQDRISNKLLQFGPLLLEQSFYGVGLSFIQKPLWRSKYEEYSSIKNALA